MRSFRATVHTSRLILCGLLLVSCTISRHPVGITGASAPVSSTYNMTAAVEESDCSYHVLFLPFGARKAPDEIIDRLVQEKGGDALVGVTVEERVAIFLLPVIWSTCTIVNGVVAKEPSSRETS